MTRARAGFTIVELLVAMFVLGILITAIVSLSSGYLGFSRRVSVINERLADLNDALGYIGTNARSAMNIVGSGTTSVSIDFGGDTFTCATTSTDPCIGLVVPVVDRGTAAISGFDLLAYRVVPLSEWSDDPGLAEGWAADATPLLLEYRAELCTGCSDPPAVPASVLADRVSLVASDLTFVEGATTFAPFTVTPGADAITVRLRGRGSGVEADTFVPNDAPLELTVSRRP